VRIALAPRSGEYRQCTRAGPRQEPRARGAAWRAEHALISTCDVPKVTLYGTRS